MRELNRGWKRLAFLLLLLAPAPVFAQAKAEGPEPRKTIDADTSRSYLRLAFNFYEQKDGGGNPNVDENMQVLQPMFLLGVGLSEKLSLSLKGQGGLVSAASTNSGARTTAGSAGGGGGGGDDDEEEDDEDGAVSGASGGGGDDGGSSLADGDRFFGLEAGLFYAWSDQVGVGAGVSYNKEDAYRSIGGNARFVYTTRDKNDTFLIRVSASFDTVDIRLFDGTGGGSENRNTYGLGLGWTHVLGRKTQGTLSYDLTYQNGFLSTSYNSVLVAGTEVQEILPDTRLRHSVFARIRHLLLDYLAVEPGVGFYVDDWGAVASSFELHAFWEFIPGVLILQPSYRFHWQRQISYFTGESESSVPRYRTQDSDLDTFTNHTFGLKLVAPSVKIFGVDTEFELGGDYTFRSDRLNCFSVTFGFLVRF